MLRLRHILLSSRIYYLALILTACLTFIRINSPRISTISSNTTYLEGTVLQTTYNGDLLKLTLKINNHENIDAYYYFKTQKSLIKTRDKVKIGCKIGLQGMLQKPTSNRVINTFNYPRYLKIKKVNYLFQIEKLTLISYSKNPLYLLKNAIYTYINIFKANPYIKMILLGDSDDVSKEVIESFRANGISHLFAISGTQVTVLAEAILTFLTKIKVSEKKRYIIVNIFTLSYLYLTGSPPAVLRAVLFFLLSSINKYNYFYITSLNLFILTLIITLLINPYYIYDLGFLYSYIISATLIICSKTLENKSKFKQLLLTSIISFLISMSITLYTFYEVNIMSILYNLFYVPFVNNILFPLAILVLFFPFLDPVLMFFISVLEKSSLFIADINIGKFIFPKLPLIVYIIYILLLFIIYKSATKRKMALLIFSLLLILHYNFYTFHSHDYIYMLDIGQGDSILVHSKNHNILIDTGGKMQYRKENWKTRQTNNMATTTIIPYLKSRGIRNLDKLILTHGDHDHLGEAKNLLTNFKVKNVYINEGNINYYERDLVKYYNAKVLKQNMTFTIGNFKFMSLNSNLKNENDSSIVLYASNKNYKFIFMGDASLKSEKYILENYNLGQIDVLKVGHHGSSTSTSEEFLKTIKPRLAIISAGVDNKFNHPHQKVINLLNKYHVTTYVTKKVGSIELDLTKNKISTYE